MAAIHNHVAMAANVLATPVMKAAQVKTMPGAGLNGQAVATAMAGSGASGAASTTATTSTSGDITSNDFLTLLVSELKNQDPTQPTDPNAYITQMVGVNSLQQLISINQELS